MTTPAATPPLKTAAVITTSDGATRSAQTTRGRSTSEYGLTVSSGVVALLITGAHALSIIPGWGPVVGAGILAGLSFLGYNVSRGMVKASAIRSIDR